MAEQQTGAMVALVPSAEDAARLAVAGGLPAEALHMTLMYLGDAADIGPAVQQDVIDSVSAAINGMPVVVGEVFHVAAFNPQGGERPACMVYGVGGDLVDAAHTLVNEAVWSASPKQKAPWDAHITASYADDLGLLATMAERVGPVRFDRIRIAFARQNLDIPLIEDDYDDAEDPDEPATGWALAEADGDRNALKRYWTQDPRGLAKWRDKKHPWTALYRHLRKFLGAERAKRVASQWFHDVMGIWPGDRRRKAKESAAPLTEAPREPEQRDDAWTAAVAGLLVAWPVLSAPLVDGLAEGAARAAESGAAALAALMAPGAAVDVIAGGLVERMAALAATTIQETAADAAGQGADAGPVEPDDGRLAAFAAATAAMIATGLTATAIESALAAPAEAVAEQVRRALVEAGTRPAGQVATRLRAALTAAEHEARRAVFEAYPPAWIEAVERLDTSTCDVCRKADGRRYPTLAEALRDYPGFGGNEACAGTPLRCRGFLRGIWTQPVTEAARPMRVQLVETGRFDLA